MNNKGIKYFYNISGLMLFMQVLKILHLVSSLEPAAILSLVLTIGLIIKLRVVTPELKEIKYRLLIVYLIALEIILGLDRIISELYYYLIIVFSLLITSVVYLCLDSLYVRKQMDENMYVIKNTCTLLIMTLILAIIGYMTPQLVS